MKVQTRAKQIVKSILHYDRLELVTLNLFWIGFIIYTASWTIIKTRQVNIVFFQVFQLLGLMIFIPAWIRLIKFKFDNEYIKILFIIFMCWASITFFRGLSLNKEDMKTTILDPWFGGLLYFTPLVMLFPKKLIYYKKVFAVIIILSGFYIVYDIMFISNLMEKEKDVLSRDIVEYFSKTLAVPISFILFTFIYHSKPKNMYALGVLFLTIFFALVRARRGLLLMTIGPLFIFYILFWIKTKSKLFMTILTFSVFFLVTAYGIYYINSQEIEILEFLEKRGMEDTRSGVERYFYNDMEGIDWVIGRGMRGRYYSPTIGEGNFRGTIETDYLNMILKGGLINLILLLLILIPAIYLGLFRSKNLLSKVSGIWILFWLLNTHPSTVQVFTLNYMIVWFAAGICYSKVIRNLPEKFLLAYFRS